MTDLTTHDTARTQNGIAQTTGEYQRLPWTDLSGRRAVLHCDLGLPRHRIKRTARARPDSQSWTFRSANRLHRASFGRKRMPPHR